MELESSMAKGIRITDGKAKYDAACKLLLSEKILLAWIMKSCLAEYRDCEIREIEQKYILGSPEVSRVPVNPDETNLPRIQSANTEDKLMTEGTVFYDIRFVAIAPGSGELIRLIINLEAQNGEDLLYALIRRGIYYCCRMISAQNGTEFVNAQYQNIRKVYSVWLCIDPKPGRKNSITKYQVQEENVVGDVHEKKSDYDLLTVVIVRLGSAEDVPEKNILRLLNILFSEEHSAEQKKQLLQQDFEIPMTQTLEGRISEMCNLSQGVENRGIAKGILQGAENAQLGNIRSLMQNLNISAEQAMTLLDISAKDRSRFASLLTKQ